MVFVDAHIPTPQFIDAHCHLSHKEFSGDLESVVKRAREANVIALNTGCNLEENKRVLSQCASHSKELLAAIGLSPHDAPAADLQAELDFVKANAEKIVAIGEIGLDFHYFKAEEEQNAQRKAFLAQLALAEKLGKPVFIHSREAEEEVIETVRSFKCKAVMHFFLQSKVLQKALDAGCWLSIPTVKSREKEKILRDAPIERLLCETDSPYAWKGRNEPEHVKSVYEEIALAKRTPLNEVEVIIYENFKKLIA